MVSLLLKKFSREENILYIFQRVYRFRCSPPHCASGFHPTISLQAGEMPLKFLGRNFLLFSFVPTLFVITC